MRIALADQSFHSLTVYKSVFLLEKSNIIRITCRDCCSQVEPGLGIFRSAYRRTGYICFSCFAHNLRILTFAIGFDNNDAGFKVSTPSTLRACTLEKPTFRTAEIVAAVYKALLESFSTSEIFLVSAGVEAYTTGEAGIIH